MSRATPSPNSQIQPDISEARRRLKHLRAQMNLLTSKIAELEEYIRLHERIFSERWQSDRLGYALTSLCYSRTHTFGADQEDDDGIVTVRTVRQRTHLSGEEAVARRHFHSLEWARLFAQRNKDGRTTTTDAVYDLLWSLGAAMQTRDILSALDAAGIIVGGEDTNKKVVNLSSMLSRDARFRSSRVAGWMLKDNGHPGVRNTGAHYTEVVGWTENGSSDDAATSPSSEHNVSTGDPQVAAD